MRFKLSLAGSELYNPHPAIHTVIANAQLSWYTQLSHWRVTDSLKAALGFSEQRKAHWLWLIGHFPSVQALREQRENTHTQGGVTLAETLPAAATCVCVCVCVCLSAEAASALNIALKWQLWDHRLEMSSFHIVIKTYESLCFVYFWMSHLLAYLEDKHLPPEDG